MRRAREGPVARRKEPAPGVGAYGAVARARAVVVRDNRVQPSCWRVQAAFSGVCLVLRGFELRRYAFSDRVVL